MTKWKAVTKEPKWRVLTSITYWPKWRALKAIVGEITKLRDDDRDWLVAVLRDLFSDYDRRKVGGPK